MDKKVSIILLNYRGVKDTLECVESLERIDYENYEIIVVDNHSEDGSYEILKEKIGGRHILIEAPDNGGFAKGNNIGIDYAINNGADFVLLLNNDTLVIENFLSEMIGCSERHSDAGIVGCKILYNSQRDTIWYGGGEIDLKRFYGYHYGEGQKDSAIYNEEKEISFTTGCVMLLPRETILKAGKLPEEYFMYYEDVDYCLRVQRAGYKIYYCPSAAVYHKVSASTGGDESPFAVRYNTRNRIIFMNKYKNLVSSMEFKKSNIFFYGSRVIRFLQYILKGKMDKARALLSGIKEGRYYINS